MSVLVAILIVLGLAGAALGAYAILAPKHPPATVPTPTAPSRIDPVADRTNAQWTDEAGAEFAGLSEAARCDLIFAVAALDDEASSRLLIHALDDPSQTVALAAAHALARSGRIGEVRAYAENHHGPRSSELLQLVSLLA